MGDENLMDGNTEESDSTTDDQTNEDTENQDDQSKDESKDDDQKAEGDQEESKDEDKKADEKSEPKAPETYDDFTMPEGIEVDTALLDAAQPVLKELDLSQEDAQKVVDLYSAKIQADSEAVTKYYADRNESWLKELESDPDVGGDKLKPTAQLVNKVISAFDTEEGEFMKFMNENQISNAAPLFKFIARLAPEFAEDTLVTGGNQKKTVLAPHDSFGWKSYDKY